MSMPSENRKKASLRSLFAGNARDCASMSAQIARTGSAFHGRGGLERCARRQATVVRNDPIGSDGDLAMTQR